MVQSTYVTQVTGTTSLSLFSDTYLIIATGPTTLTLPAIAADGMVYNLIRNDTSPTGTVSVVSSSGETIFQNLGPTGGGGTTGLSLRPQSTAQLQSYNNAWYLTQNDPINRVESKCIFSAGFPGPGATFAISATRGIILNFPYRGSISEVISQVEIVSRAGGAGTGGVVYDLRTSGAATNIMSISVTLTSTRSLTFISTVTSPGLIPTGPTIMEIGITRSSGTISAIVDAIVVR